MERVSPVSGGNRNTARGFQSSVSGGDVNTAIGIASSVNGGDKVPVSGDCDWGGESMVFGNGSC